MNGISPDQPNRESSRSPSARDGGSDERTRVGDLSDEDNGGAQLNTKTFISTLAASNQPVSKQRSAYLKDKGQQIAGLEQQLGACEKRAYAQQLVHDYEERGTSHWHFVWMTFTMYFKSLSSLTSSTPIPGSTSSRWTSYLHRNLTKQGQFEKV